MNDLTHGSRAYIAGSLLMRRGTVHVMSELQNRSVADIVRDRYGDDPDILAVARSQSGTADTATAGWAKELSRQDVQAFLESLTTRSGYAALVSRGLAVDFSDAATVRVPFDDGDGTELAGAFIGENGVIPVKRGVLGSAVLKRYKLGVVSMFTEELSRSSPVNAESFVGRMMLKHTATALDQHFFSDDPGIAGIAPPGIVNGVTSLPASVATTAVERAIEDLTALVSALVATGNTGRIVLVMNTAQRLALAMMRDGNQFIFRDELSRGELMGVEVVSTATVPEGNLFVIDCENLFTGLGVPEVDASRAATFVMANADTTVPTNATSPADRTAVGTAERVPPHGGLSVLDSTQRAAGKVGENATAMSTFQQWCVALRNVLPVSWTMGREGSVAWIEGVTW